MSWNYSAIQHIQFARAIIQHEHKKLHLFNLLTLLYWCFLSALFSTIELLYCTICYFHSIAVHFFLPLYGQMDFQLFFKRENPPPNMIWDACVKECGGIPMLCLHSVLERAKSAKIHFIILLHDNWLFSAVIHELQPNLLISNAIINIFFHFIRWFDYDVDLQTLIK